ncbi:hypothetical protein MHU86_18038 [Fragilaria crotonensis]|nr:hypothetical protein MHU86_18038 [Fragilaria crotonensis]
MSLIVAARDLSLRELALQAAASANLSSFAAAGEPNPVHAEKIVSTFAKTCTPLTRLAILCDTNVTKQLVFIQPNFKMATLSCPFLTVGRNNEDVFAGSLGDSMDLLCPVTIRMKDVRGDVISICESRPDVNKYNLATSETDPLEEEGLPPPEGQDPIPPGPDRIMINLNVATKEPCFVAIPKVYPVTSGAAIQTEHDMSVITTPALENYSCDSMEAVWYESMRYGIRHMDNYSIQATNTLFDYAGVEKREFIHENRNLASRFTTIVTFLTPDEPLYHVVAQTVRAEKDKVTMAYGTKILNLMPPNRVGNTPAHNIAGNPIDLTTQDPTGISTLLEGLAKAISESSSKTLTGTEREKASEAEDAKRFYSILFASIKDTIDEDGIPTKSFVKAKIHPLFIPVLTANKNSKATKAMQEAVESMAAELSTHDDRYASASNLFPRMFDQPLTAALRTGQWEYQHTVLNPEGIKTNVGIHHFAPPRTWSASYKTRQEGETKLTQQEQVEEDRSRIGAKATDLYHMGCMGTLPDINEMIGNFYAIMCVIIEFERDRPPLIWTEVAKFAQILRTNEGRQWAALHRNMREVLSNVGQDIQSTIAGFVSEARKTNYKTAMKNGNEISPCIFDMAQHQGTELRRNFQGTILTMTAGTYKEASIIYKLFQPEQQNKENSRKREANTEFSAQNSTPPGNRNRPFQQSAGGGGGNRNTPPNSQQQHTNHVTPNNSPTASGGQALPGKTVFVHSNPAPSKLPHPGAIFPHPNRPNQFTVLCCRSAYDGRTCPLANCAYYHFPSQLNQVNRDLKDKLKTWVIDNQDKVSWHPDVANWANPPGNVANNNRP